MTINRRREQRILVVILAGLSTCCGRVYYKRRRRYALCLPLKIWCGANFKAEHDSRSLVGGAWIYPTTPYSIFFVLFLQLFSLKIT